MLARYARHIGQTDLGLVLLTAVGALETHRLQPDARQARAVGFKREINRSAGFWASANEIAHKRLHPKDNQNRQIVRTNFVRFRTQLQFFETGLRRLPNKPQLAAVI
jgi:hypothetical protein